MRLGDMDALCESMRKWLAKLKPEIFVTDRVKSDVLNTVIVILENAPAIESEPVLHGRWNEYFAYGCWHYDCPFCDDGYATKEREKVAANHCQNCGAKLIGGAIYDETPSP